ncbi:MAG: hypothetical protein MZV63_59440 [Marinilabiliales bacterium]|nr:hypothetical protein [Marinilabiliales bacterium]
MLYLPHARLSHRHSKLAQRQTFTDVVTNKAGTGPEIEVKFYGGTFALLSPDGCMA